MSRCLRLLILVVLLAMTPLAQAETTAVDVQHLSPNEAAQLAKTQLSPQGKVVVLASKHTVVIDDDAKHVAAARALIRRLDVATPSLQVELRIETVSRDDITGLIAEGRALPGGWLRLQAPDGSLDAYSRHDFSLRLSAGRSGRIETGTVEPITADTRQWLAAHGIPASETIETVPITAGFNLKARLSGKGRAHVSVQPWILRHKLQGGVSGQPQVLIGLGTTGTPQTPPSTTAPTMRIYGQPTQFTHKHEIRISEADTDVSLPLNQWVTLGAVRASAGRFGQAMLSSVPNGTYRDVLIRLRVKAVR